MSLSIKLKIKKTISLAKKAMKKGDASQALDLYNSVLQYQPKHPIASKAVSKIKKEISQNNLKQTQVVDPPQDQIDVLVNLYHSGNLMQIEQACKKLLETYPNSVIVYEFWGATLKMQDKLEEAVQVLSKLIQLNPAYIDAYNNLGVVFQELGQLENAIKNYNKAIQLSPIYVDAYFNRGNALKELGHLKEAIESYSKAIQIKPDYAEAYNNRGNALKELGHLKDAIESYGKAIQMKPDYTDAYNNRGVALKELGHLKDAIESYGKAIQIKPDYAAAYFNRGNALKELGHLKEAVENYVKATLIKRDYTDAYFACGVALRELGHLKEAVENYNKTIRLNPTYIDAYNNLGGAFLELGLVKEALESYDKAIQIKSDYADVYFNRGVAFKELGQHEKAVENFDRALELEPENDGFWAGFAAVLEEMKFTRCDDALIQHLLVMLERPTIHPHNAAKIVLNALYYYPKFRDILDLYRSGFNEDDIGHFVEKLSSIPLLLRLMELSPVADLELENLLTILRKVLLKKVTSGENVNQGIPFFVALAMNCFINEYIFVESEIEKDKVGILQEEIKETLRIRGEIPVDKILLLGAYRPLYSVSWADKLQGVEWPHEVRKVIEQQINNVIEEQSIRLEISCLSPIEDRVSQVVRDQYEENPYPRWIKTGLSNRPKTIRQVIQSLKFHTELDLHKLPQKPEILVAGCGTGQHALLAASRFLNSKVLAIDLSLSSLSYAKRKTKELGVENIEYLQADILKLNQLEKYFDIIESVGVLHHMDDPIAGWRILVDRLRPGGLMKIGLYSEIARKHIVEARSEIAKKTYKSTSDGIRKFREDFMKMKNSSDSNIANVKSLFDFYTMSTCRDLLFHVQEHRFSLPQIKMAIDDLGLKFLGFELSRNSVMARFKNLYPKKSAPTSLSLWHEFEVKYPGTFIGMYQFWVQKV